MTINIKPKFQSAIADDPSDTAAGRVTPSLWNEGSDFTMATGKLIGRTSAGDGAAEEIDLDADGTLAADSDTVVATQKAVKTYVDTEIGGINGTAYTLLASHTISSGESSVSFTGIDAADVLIKFGAVTSNGAGTVFVAVSTNNGSTYSGTKTLLPTNSMGTTAKDGVAWLTGLSSGHIFGVGVLGSSNSGMSGGVTPMSVSADMGAAVDAMQVSASSGSFTAGTIELWGR